ncbi:MAG: trypsin-like peptidase domain-containing protein [Gammaproteobacteria bacterium]|nr:trypsin-like peptidase domain-containing protein [Gammaproteobacteria bacterium]MCP5199407.1 trypsin-like peptidase domain-containing protein [Gammaproteobacteria bacterium]
MRAFLFVVQWILIGLGVAVVALVAWPSGDPAGALAELRQRLHGVPARGYAEAVRRAAPAVVAVRAITRGDAPVNPLTGDPLFRRFFGATADAARTESSLGSGVVLDATGTVLTNFHVIEGADQVVVSLADGRAANARVVGTDPDTDVAVLAVELTGLPAIELGDAAAVRVGDIVLAIGNPFGIGQTVTQGIVSATGRNRVGINTFENFIQTDAAINVGNSGGALVDVHGALIGLNAARADSDGIGFAIPITIVLDVARQILATGSVTRGWLGIDARDLSPSLARLLGTERGIAVLGVMREGPADRAGIRPGDAIVAIDGHDIGDSREALERIAALRPGTAVPITGVRTGRRYEVTATAAQRPRRP